MSRLSTGLFVLSAFVVGSLLDGCTGLSTFSKPEREPVAVVETPAITPAAPLPQPTPRPNTGPQVPLKFIAVGHGALGNSFSSSQWSPQQQKLMAMRAARVDAYRNLAEQVNGFKISGNTTVAAMAAQNDQIRSSVDAYIRGARLITIQPVSDGIYEATVEMEIGADLMDLLGINGQIAATAPISALPRQDDPTRNTMNGCVGLGCGAAR